jgi:hypothetical protein
MVHVDREMNQRRLDSEPALGSLCTLTLMEVSKARASLFKTELERGSSSDLLSVDEMKLTT